MVMGENNRLSGRSAMAEESLRMVIFKRLHPAGAPKERGEGKSVNTVPFGLTKEITIHLHKGKLCNCWEVKNERKADYKTICKVSYCFGKNVCLQRHEHKPGKALTNNRHFGDPHFLVFLQNCSLTFLCLTTNIFLSLSLF